MKKILASVLACMMIFSLAACGRNSESNENNTNQSNITKEVPAVKEMITMNITIENTTFTVTLDMSELNGNEKYSNLSSSLRADTASSPGTINEGDLMLYGNNTLVLFYKTFNTSYSYVKLGHINDTTGLAKALGLDSVRVTFSVL